MKWLNKEERTKKQFKDFLNHSRRSKTQPYGSTQQEKIKNQNALLRKLLEEKSITNDQTKALVERRLKITRSTPQNLSTAPEEVNDRATENEETKNWTASVWVNPDTKEEDEQKEE